MSSMLITLTLFIGYWVGGGAMGGQHSTALLGYNCSHADIDVTEFSLLEENDCPEHNDVISQERVTVQLVQMRQYKYVHAYAMQVTRTLRVMACHGYGVTHEITQRVLSVSANQVMQVYEKGEFSDGLIKLGSIPPNSTYSWNGNLRGYTHEHGWCEGETVRLHGLVYPNSVLVGQYDFVTKDSVVTADLRNDQLKVFGGEICKYSDKHCMSLVYGDIFWSTAESDKNCNPYSYPVLFDGVGLINHYPATSVTESKQIITVKSEHYAFSLVLTEKTMICSQQAFATEHALLYIIMVPPHGLRYFKKVKLHPLGINLNTYMDSKFIYVERHLQRQLSELNNNVMSQICKLERQVLANLKATAMLDPSQFGYAYKKQVGFSAIVRGEILYLIKCVPIRVFWRETGQCYQEIPVQYLNNSYFLNPRTRVLTHWGEEISCSTFLPVKFKVHNEWLSVVPNVVKSTPPLRLNTGTNFSAWKYENINMKLGIYTMEDIEKHRTAVLYPSEFSAISKTIAANAAGYTTENQGLNMFAMVNSADLKKVVINQWNEVWGMFKTFGSYSGGIIMVVIIFQALSYICKGGIHCTAISKIFGGLAGCFAFICPDLAALAVFFGREDMKKSGKAKATVRGAFREFRNQRGQCLEGTQNEEDVELGGMGGRGEEQVMYPLQELRVQQSRIRSEDWERQ